jgi:hypothetical protein
VGALPPGLAHAAETVETQGLAAVVDGDVPAARDRALDDAKRKAVEQVAGAHVSATSVTESFELVEDRILSRASGFVKRYEVLDEVREGDVYRVRIQAEVDAASLVDDLERLFGTKPRVIVLVAEQNIGSSEPSYWWGSSGASADLSLMQTSLISAWQPRGYKFVDPGMLGGEFEVKGPMSSPDLSNGAARRIAADADADVAVVGKVLVNDAGAMMDGVDMHAYHAVGTLRVLSVDTGEILAVADDTGVAAHVDPNLGGRLAIKALAKKVGQSLEEKLLSRWTTEAASSRDVELVVTGVRSGAVARTIEKRVAERIRGVERIRARRRRNEKAFFAVAVRARTRDFARDLEQESFGTFTLEVGEVSRRKIVARVAEGAP